MTSLALAVSIQLGLGRAGGPGRRVVGCEVAGGGTRRPWRPPGRLGGGTDAEPSAYLPLRSILGRFHCPPPAICRPSLRICLFRTILRYRPDACGRL